MSKGDKTLRIFAADIGGTSSRFGFFETDRSGELLFKKSLWLKTGSVDSFLQLLATLKDESFPLQPKDADIAVFAVPGPALRNELCILPNVAWNIDFDEVVTTLSLTNSFLINDFVAQAYACVSPMASKARQIIPGDPQSGGAIAVIGAGTGLGKAVLVFDGQKYIAGASEGGHVSFAAADREEFDFFEFALNHTGQKELRVEDVVTGRGLSLVHRYLTGRQLAAEEVALELVEGSKTLEWVSRFYGRACRNFALEILATGGVFISGGVAAKNPILIEHPAFREAFCRSESHSQLLKKIPVWLVDNQENGLWGAATYAVQQIKR